MKFVVTGLVLAICALTCGCQTTSPKTTFAPIKYDEAYKLGQMIKFAGNGSYVARTSGSSMEPVLSPNTVIVVRPIKFEELRAGMNVGYINKEGYRVLHQLVRRAGPNAWVAKGINNVHEDKERVTRKNLLGVLYTVIYNEASQVTMN